MLITIVSAADSNLSEIADLTFPNKQAYASKHRYAYSMLRGGFRKDRPPQWSKIFFVQKLLPHVDWLLWTDADSLIMNPDIKVETLIDNNFELIISRDFGGLNTGVFLIKNCPNSFKLLQEIWGKKEFLYGATEEQGALNDIIIKPNCYAVKVLNQRIMNSFDYTLYQTAAYPEGQYQAGDFILHFPALSVKEKLRQIRKHL